MFEPSFSMPRLSASNRWISRSARRGLVIALIAPGILHAGRTFAADVPPLAWFAGTWQCAGRFEPSGKPIEARLQFDWNEAAHALVKRHDDRPPNVYHAQEVWGSGDSTGLTATIVDAYGGTRLFTSTGWTGESLVWTRASGAKPVERFAYVRESEDRLRIDWATSRDGSVFTVGDTLSCDRQKR